MERKRNNLRCITSRNNNINNIIDNHSVARDVNAKPKIKTSEFAIQKSFFEWLKHYPHIDEVTISIPNGGIRTAKEAIFLKMAGLKVGAPDVFIFYPSNGYHGLAIEFKSEHGNITVPQKQFLNTLAMKGYNCAVCYSLEDAIIRVEEHLKCKRDERELELISKARTLDVKIIIKNDQLELMFTNYSNNLIDRLCEQIKNREANIRALLIQRWIEQGKQDTVVIDG